MKTHWMCFPCYTRIPGRAGMVTVHGEGDALTVWCPWCGDMMDPADEFLTAREIQQTVEGDA